MNIFSLSFYEYIQNYEPRIVPRGGVLPPLKSKSSKPPEEKRKKSNNKINLILHQHYHAVNKIINFSMQELVYSIDSQSGCYRPHWWELRWSRCALVPKGVFGRGKKKRKYWEESSEQEMLGIYNIVKVLYTNYIFY